MEKIKMKLRSAFKKKNWKKIKIEFDSAIENKQWKEACDLLDHHKDLFQLLTENCDLQQSVQLLTNAIIRDTSMDIVTQLISPHNINMHETSGKTALYLAVLKQAWDLVPVLLEHGADVNIPNYWHNTALTDAVYYGAPADIITQLISPHNINRMSDEADSVLHLAVYEKRWELVPVLLQHGADINQCSDSIATPLHHAAYHGAPADIVTQLISPRNINMQNERGITALHQAVSRKPELVPLLLQHGADPSVLDSFQPDQDLVLSLKALCISTIRRHMTVKSDEAYKGLGLPGKLVEDVKLRPQAEDIVKRGRCT